jgi:hypothetical protein
MEGSLPMAALQPIAYKKWALIMASATLADDVPGGST